MHVGQSEAAVGAAPPGVCVRCSVERGSSEGRERCYPSEDVREGTLTKLQQHAGALGLRVHSLWRILLGCVSSLAVSGTVLDGFLGCKTSKPEPPADPGGGDPTVLWDTHVEGRTVLGPPRPQAHCPQRPVPRAFCHLRKQQPAGHGPLLCQGPSDCEAGLGV